MMKNGSDAEDRDAQIRATASAPIRTEGRHVRAYANVLMDKCGNDVAEFYRVSMPITIALMARQPDLYEPDHPVRELVTAYDTDALTIDWESLGGEDAWFDRLNDYLDRRDGSDGTV